MARVVLANIEAGLGSAAAINANFQAIAAALERLLSRVGDTPNQMESDLDLNGHTLLNSGASDNPNRVVSYSEMTSYIAAHSSGLVVQRQELQIATSGQTNFTLQDLSYTPGAFNLAIYVDGIRKFAPTDYTETSASTVLFTPGLALGAEVLFVTNEYLGSVELPAHTHPWAQITNVPVYTTRWPTWDEVSGKPGVFPPTIHNHSAAEIVVGRLADPRRGVFVQPTQPSSPAVGDVWFWV